ncbi:YitT family protein [Bacillus kwashiorkori]|uniref:YitT family protein n=1 Tax=Bacillus kwashiorkori TaxID=1522318 RepID=UPI0007812580|nr:YitT family protein [Bacillus kwashiorkori]
MKKGKQSKPLSPVFEKIKNYLYIVFGATIVAISFNVFLLPNEVASGGVSGISTILNGLFKWEPAYVQWALNIPLFIAGVLVLGFHYGVKTLVGTIFLPLAVFLTKDWNPWTLNPLLAAIFGGMGVGFGIGIVFRGNASTGGTDLAAQILAKFTGFSLGKCVAIIDGMIVISAAIVFNIEKGLFALIALFVTSKTIDMVQIGWNRSKMALIITEHSEEVRHAILTKIDRGLTRIEAYGGYTNNQRNMFMVVVDQTEFTNLKQVVKSIDPEAFVIVVDASEVLGQGFTPA